MIWIYEKNEKISARYILGQVGKKPLICIGVNPSTATPQNLDRTINRVINFSKKNNYDGWIMLNIYPQRSQDPNYLDNTKNKDLHLENLQFIKKIVEEYRGDIWCAWGETIEKRSYLKQCLLDIFNIINKYDCKWIHLGTVTTSGHPRHPSRSKSDVEFCDFDIKNYIEKL